MGSELTFSNANGTIKIEQGDDYTWRVQVGDGSGKLVINVDTLEQNASVNRVLPNTMGMQEQLWQGSWYREST